MFELNKKESPVLGLLGSGGGLPYLAGLSGVGGPLYVDDVFSTTIYKGDSTTGRNIPTGIDNTNKSLLWVKSRSSSGRGHALHDTERGVGYRLSSNDANAQSSGIEDVTGFNNDGFTTENTTGFVNNNGEDYVAWNFKATPGFFDVVTYTGNDSVSQVIDHSLGSVPGCVMIKRTNNTSPADWYVYHVGHEYAPGEGLSLNHTTTSTSAYQTLNGVPTSTTFTAYNHTNIDGGAYVAYIFAHDDAQFGTNENESIIKCGSFTGGGSVSTPKYYNIGFEPQFVLYKRYDPSTGQGDWYMMDVMRCMADNGSNQPLVYANSAGDEGFSYSFWADPNGFATSEDLAGTGATYIYIAIRRPNKPPESGTDVFHAYYGTPASDSTITTGFPFDMQIAKEASSANSHRLLTRNLGLNTRDTTSSRTMSLQPAGTDEGQLSNLSRSVYNTTFKMPTAYANNLMIFQSFKRAPGFMDIVNYRGANSIQTLNHNLGVAPEMMWIKKWNTSGDRWQIYMAPQGNTKYSPGFATDPFYNTSVRWNNTSPTPTEFTLGVDDDLNSSGNKYVNFLFASLAGISKIGTYPGTGNAFNVDCEFTTNARFVMIKRTDSETQGSTPDRTDWYIWDYARGIVSGNDPFYQLSRNWAQTTNTDYIDPHPENKGFRVKASGGGINVNGGTYVFFAVA